MGLEGKPTGWVEKKVAGAVEGVRAFKASQYEGGVVQAFVQRTGLKMSVGSLGGQINTMRGDMDAIVAEVGKDPLKDQELLTRREQLDRSIKETAARRSNEAGMLQRYYEGKLSQPMAERQQWQEAFNSADAGYQKLAGSVAEQRNAYAQATALWKAVERSGPPEEVAKLAANMKIFGDKLAQAERSLGDCQRRMQENRGKMDAYDLKNRRVLAKVGKWKGIAEDGLRDTTAETFSRPKSDVGEVSPELATADNKEAAVPSTSETAARPASVETSRTGRDEIVARVAEFLKEGEGFDGMLSKLLSSPKYGSALKKPLGSLKFKDAWNDLVKQTGGFEATKMLFGDADNKAVEALGEGATLEQFARLLKDREKGNPTGIIENIMLMAEGINKNEAEKITAEAA